MSKKKEVPRLLAVDYVCGNCTKFDPTEGCKLNGHKQKATDIACFHIFVYAKCQECQKKGE